MKLTDKQMSGSFDEFIKKLIEEKIPFYFDCIYGEHSRIGYLMNETINNVHFNGYILDSEKTTDALSKEFSEKILKDLIVEKPGKLHVGRSNFADLTKSNDLDTIFVVVKALKTYQKDKGINRIITGNKQEVHINIDFLCDKTRINDLIDYTF
ncbi:MAG: hypothetical protein NC548_39490 [Lachnospiraceae bacterium]|nr:hypothetical protein [Lachnospiraceae bacterium]